MAEQQGGRFGFVGKSFNYVVSFFQTTETVPEVCKFPGCNQPCYIENDGRVYDFCGKSHAREYRYKEEAAQRQTEQKKRKLVGTFGHHVHGTPIDPGNSLSGSYVVGSADGDGASSYTPVAQGSDVFGRSNGGPSHTRSGATYGVNVVSQERKFGSDVIRFYNRDEPYYQFTNFYPAPITLEGKEWPTTEHYFQAQKFIGTPFTEVIRGFQRPREAFDYSRNPAVSRWRRKDWEDVKMSVMRKALLAKFSQHKDLRELLLSTKGKKLIEHSPYDSFWGNGGDDRGQNRLGLLLMDIRSDLQKGSKIGNVDTAKTTQSHPPSTVCRKTIHRSASDPSRSGSSSSSMMELSYRQTEEEDQHRQKYQKQPDSLNTALVQQTTDEETKHLISFETGSLGDQPSASVPAANLGSSTEENSEVDRLMIADKFPDKISPPIKPTSTAVGSKDTPTESTINVALDTATDTSATDVTTVGSTTHTSMGTATDSATDNQGTETTINSSTSTVPMATVDIATDNATKTGDENVPPVPGEHEDVDTTANIVIPEETPTDQPTQPAVNSDQEESTGTTTVREPQVEAALQLIAIAQTFTTEKDGGNVLTQNVPPSEKEELEDMETEETPIIQPAVSRIEENTMNGSAAGVMEADLDGDEEMDDT